MFRTAAGMIAQATGLPFRTAENNFDFQYKKNILMSGVASLSALAYENLLCAV